MNLLAELQRRNVHRAALFYAGAAWLLVQVATQVFPFYELPAWTVRVVITAVLIGFPFAMLFSWFYEWTPQGIKRESEIDRSASVTQVTGKKLDKAIIAVLGLAVILLLANTFVLHKDAGTADNTISAKSIAVLPFVNMSGEAANEYFSDGVSEEILNVLARTPELLVAARTSSFSFKGGKEEVPKIAKALKVRMVLEGSVRRQGERVRITAQLIDASNGFHVWSQTFDRDLKDIFAIQDEIAKAIADALKVKLGAANAQGVPTTGTTSIEAYDLYLRGLALWQRRREDSLWQAIALFERAAASDPLFAQAYAGQALVYSVLADYSARISSPEALSRARDHAERAITLDPSLPEPYAALGQIASFELRREAAEVMLRRAIALRPSFATAHQWLGTSLMASGKLEAALVAAERSSMLDPLSRVIANNHSQVLLALGRYADASAECERLLAFSPDYEGCIDNTGFVALLLGHFDAARPLLLRFAELRNPSASVLAGELIDALQGQGDRHALALRLSAFTTQSNSQPGSGNFFEPYEMSALLILLDEPELALARLEQLANDGGGYADWALMVPALDPIRCDPRFVAVVQKLKTSDPHFAKVCAEKS